MYKTSTFLTSIFRKFRIQDKWIRGRITWLYRDVISSILEDVPPQKQIIIFKEFLSSVQSTVVYLEQCVNLPDYRTSPFIEQYLQVLKSNIDLTVYLIKKVGIRSGMPDSFESIMKQVNLDDIACDIGDCLIILKDTQDEDVKKETTSRLDVLLHDYNLITNSDLKVRDVICIQEPVESEL